MDFPAISASKLAFRWPPVSPNDTITIRELASFGSLSLNDYEVGPKPEGVAAYDPGARNMGNGKDGKDNKEAKEAKEIAQGPDPVGAFQGGSPYLPGALGFPPNITHKIFKLSE